MKFDAPELPTLLRQSSYYVCNVGDFTSGTSSHLSSRPMPGAWDAWVVASKLGRNGFQRIQTFRNYGSGWDFGSGDPMSENAYSSLCKFLGTAIFPPGKAPSVFLTGSGNLELAWEALSGESVQAEFGPKKIEYYHGATGEEGELPVSEVKQVAALLSA